ncbi:hypothetical protein CEXT_257861 [Caerostris extrusa]|uniref:Uncharacterized protein n=1 Tax=Caerostris extrusa TaxID=172846 RepID=A0AAV4XI31_CAEEX|nr:hypothetical protein CEXT_257861 [Caerostris extrusa]
MDKICYGEGHSTYDSGMFAESWEGSQLLWTICLCPAIPGIFYCIAILHVKFFKDFNSNTCSVTIYDLGSFSGHVVSTRQVYLQHGQNLLWGSVIVPMILGMFAESWGRISTLVDHLFMSCYPWIVFRHVVSTRQVYFTTWTKSVMGSVIVPMILGTGKFTYNMDKNLLWGSVIVPMILGMFAESWGKISTLVDHLFMSCYPWYFYCIAILHVKFFKDFVRIPVLDNI